MAKRKKQQKSHSAKLAKSPTQKSPQKSPQKSSVQRNHAAADEMIFEPDPRTGSPLLLRIGIALVIAWILTLLAIALYK